MDEISLTQKWINSLFLLGGGFLFFYTLIYCTLWLAMAILGGLVKQDDEDASILDRSARTSRDRQQPLLAGSWDRGSGAPLFHPVPSPDFSNPSWRCVKWS